ncbi:MAG: ATP-dependent DNA helicase RecQ [Rhodopirellula sp.]|nr:ATP-dependent DNA helicase RecQ [Rhodopirellula sp.]
MTGKLDAFLNAACDIADCLGEDPKAQKGSTSVPVAMLTGYLPRGVWTGDHEDQQRLESCLDAVGVAVEGWDGKRADLRYRSWDTGPLDQATRLRDGFRARIFGPKELLSKASLVRLAGYSKAGTTDFAGVLGAALESVGFKSLGTWQMKRGKNRLVIQNEQLTLQLKSAPVRFAAKRHFKTSKPVPSDDLLRRHFPSFSRYTCAAQRDAVHALLAPDGPEVVIARMPTGSGKSLLYLLASDEWRRRTEKSTAIVVSPVIALMNDQVRKIQQDYEFTGLRVAEINSTVPAPDRTKIYRKLRKGELDALFLSPEKLVDPFFQQILIDCAAHVRLFVVDEAHMVAEWGQDFRPDFFRLGVVRNRLLAENPKIKTLMLSATLTEDSERTLLQVFRNPAGVARFEDPSLRKELSIRVIANSQEAGPTETLLALVRQVPRPCIVYCTRRDHVRRLRKEFRQLSIRRVMDYTGATASDARRERLEAFQRGDVDFVLATSAFGLGVDKADVRTVIHFDVPRSVDEYYQQIGRAARDHWTGHAFLLYSPSSMGQATKDNKAIIKPETAAARALAFLSERLDLPADGPGAALVPLHALPGHIAQASELNRNWNFAVLNILEQMGDIEVDRAVLRTVRVQPGSKPERLRRYPTLASCLARHLQASSPRDVDLGKLCLSKRVSFSDLERDLVAAVLDGAIELIRDDDTSEQEREEWVLVRRHGLGTWSPEHISRLVDYHVECHKRAEKQRRELRDLVRGKRCRMGVFSTVYGYSLDKPCGHCDRCDCSLSIKPEDVGRWVEADGGEPSVRRRSTARTARKPTNPQTEQGAIAAAGANANGVSVVWTLVGDSSGEARDVGCFVPFDS